MYLAPTHVNGNASVNGMMAITGSRTRGTRERQPFGRLSSSLSLRAEGGAGGRAATQGRPYACQRPTAPLTLLSSARGEGKNAGRGGQEARRAMETGRLSLRHPTE